MCVCLDFEINFFHTELERVVVEKLCSSSRTFVGVLDLISVWVSEPVDVSFAQPHNTYTHHFNFNNLPEDVRQRFNCVDDANMFVPMLIHLQVFIPHSSGNVC